MYPAPHTGVFLLKQVIDQNSSSGLGTYVKITPSTIKYEKDQYYYNLYIPQISRPHFLGQVCKNCGLARACHHPSSKKQIESDRLGKSSDPQSECKKFDWCPLYERRRLEEQKMKTLEDWF